MWVDHPDFLNLVASDWAKPINGPPRLVFWRKLMQLKHTLKAWNWTVFGNIFNTKKELQSRIQSLEVQLQQGWSESVHSDWHQTRTELCKVERWENELLRHQAKMDWTKNGDLNSKFFHAVIKEKKKGYLTQITRGDDTISSNANERSGS